MVEKYAMIVGEDVQNIAVFKTREDANYVTKAVYGDTAIAVNVENINIDPRGKYRDGKFYNVDDDGKETEAEQIPTYDEKIKNLTVKSNDVLLAVADLIGGNS